MAYSYIEYQGDGATTTFSIPFTYAAQSEIAVFVGGTQTTAFTFTSANTIALTTAPANAAVVRVARITDLQDRAVDFQNGSVLSEEDLDNALIQVFHASQEAVDKANESIAKDTDGLFDAQNRRIKNVANPVNPQDAATKVWSETGMTAQLSQATTQASNAAASATAANTSATNAASSASSASGSATAAATSATNAATSASNASTSATSAAGSATTATTQASAASTSATNAANSASAAASSASAASASQSSASSSASTATTQATNAANSATSASNSASAASTSATNAANSATAAAGSATSAAGSATTATTQAGIATTQATSATTAASNAVNSATSSSNSATAAAASAAAAATSEANANTSAISAASSAASAAAALDNFDDRYLGAKTADPALDNDGNALITGALYFNSVDGVMKIYTASGWIAASSASVATMNKFRFTATSGQTVFTGADDGSATLSISIGAEIVTLNGIVLEAGTDYTPASGSITLASAATAGDELNIYAFGNFQVADTYSIAQADAKFATNVQVNSLTSQINAIPNPVAMALIFGG